MAKINGTDSRDFQRGTINAVLIEGKDGNADLVVGSGRDPLLAGEDAELVCEHDGNKPEFVENGNQGPRVCEDCPREGRVTSRL